MTFQLEITGDRAALSGELTIYTVGDIKRRLGEALSPDTTARGGLDIDLHEVAEFDTAGLQLMLLVQRHPGARVRFVNPSAAVQRLVNLANVGRLLDFQPQPKAQASLE